MRGLVVEMSNVVCRARGIVSKIMCVQSSDGMERFWKGRRIHISAQTAHENCESLLGMAMAALVGARQRRHQSVSGDCPIRAEQ